MTLYKSITAGLLTTYLTLQGMVVNSAVASTTDSETCQEEMPKTDEQIDMIYRAYYFGMHYGLGHTLGGIVWQESIVGEYIVKVNAKDGKYGSYGITHVTLEWAMHVEGVDNPWKAKAEIVPKLMCNDMYAMHLAVRKLLANRDKGWRVMVSRYNGKGVKARKYVDNVSDKVLTLIQCLNPRGD